MGKLSVEKPWLKFYPPESIGLMPEHETIYQHVLRCNKDHLKNTAIRFFDHKISYAELLGTASRCAAALASLGVKKGDVVALCSATVPETAMALYGASKLGATVLTLDPRRGELEIERFIEDAKVSVLLLMDMAYDHVSSVLPDIACLKKVVILSVENYMAPHLRLAKQFTMPAPRIPYNERVIRWKDFLRLGNGVTVPTAAYGDNKVAAITLTGGTTGVPKGVMLSDEGFNAIPLHFKNVGLQYERGERFMNIIPVFASYGLVTSLHMPLSLGLEIIMIPKFEANKAGWYMRKYRPNHTCLVPAHYEKMMNSKELRNFDLSFFRIAASGGDTMSVGLEERLNRFFEEHGCTCHPLSQGYGMSEVSSAASLCLRDHSKSLSVGYPMLTNTISIFKPGTTEELNCGEEGEVCITGPAMMLGYYHNEKETAKVMRLHPDGKVWIHSGDLGMMDKEGFLFIQGRIKRMITRFDGHKIFPVHLEGIMSEHPAVRSCAVVGVADPNHMAGMLAVGVVQPAEGADREQLRAELFEMIDKNAEDRARPSVIEFVDDMPYTSMGKIDYSALSAAFADKV